MVITIEAKNLKPVLMKGAKSGVKNIYYLIKEGDQLIFIVSPGRNGIEFNKTVGYFSKFPSMQTYQCLYGQGIMVMQRNEFDDAKEFKVVTLNVGRQVVVPSGWAMCLINTGNNLLVVLRNSYLDEQSIDTKAILEKKGLCYYVVEKKGEINFEPNPNYKVHPQITTE